MNVSVILLAGGTGSRMGTSVPKQFLDLKGKPIALYSYELFASLPYVTEIVVVCPEEYRYLFDTNLFAEPGDRRQDSAYNGFLKTSRGSELICVHDTARPFIEREDIDALYAAAVESGAATLARPVKYTIKQAQGHFVTATLDRDSLYEIHTPQMIASELLEEGFANAQKYNLTVTDDVSLVEAIDKPVRLVSCAESNVKLTTPHDLAKV